MKNSISAVIQRMVKDCGIRLVPAKMGEVEHFEAVTGVRLPDEMRTFYSLYSEMEEENEMFRIIPLAEIIENGALKSNYIEFAEYMIYSDTWAVTINGEDRNDYFIEGYKWKEHSFADFLDRYLNGGVDKGLYNLL